MPRKKKPDSLPPDLADLADAMADLEAQEDLHDEAEVSQSKLISEELESLEHAYRLVASTREGAAVLRHIMLLTGFVAPLVAQNKDTLEVNPNATLYNTSKRDLWLAIRSRLPAQLLREIEIPLEVI